MSGILHILISILILQQVTAQFGTSKQKHGYIEVRQGCHMFYWLFYAAEMGQEYTKRPLIVWLQGGPGSSATGDANFKLIGPMDLNLQERKSAWTKKFNVLFVDNPVGTGFSYVDNSSLYVSTNAEVAQDLIKFLAGFYIRHTEFMTVDLYICGQSYGGKMAAEFALRLDQSMKQVVHESTLKGVALGNAWISPVDYVLGWAPLLEAIGAVDTPGALKIREAADQIKHLIEINNNYAAMLKTSELQDLMSNETISLNFYDMSSKSQRTTKAEENNPGLLRSALEFSRIFGDTRRQHDEYEMDYIMNTLVKPDLNIPDGVVWGAQSESVIEALAYDFMKPAIKRIGRLLNTTDMKVIMYNGNYDVISDTLGQQSWLNDLKWKGASKYQLAPREPIWINDQLEGYVKAHANFKFYWVNGAGHSVPAENSAVMEMILKDLTGF